MYRHTNEGTDRQTDGQTERLMLRLVIVLHINKSADTRKSKYSLQSCLNNIVIEQELQNTYALFVVDYCYVRHYF